MYIVSSGRSQKEWTGQRERVVFSHRRFSLQSPVNGMHIPAKLVCWHRQCVGLNGLRMVWEWFESGLRVVWEWFESGLRVVWEWFESGLRMGWEWFESGLSVVWEWFERGVVWEWFESGLRVVWEWFESGLSVVWEQFVAWVWFGKVCKWLENDPRADWDCIGSGLRVVWYDLVWFESVLSEIFWRWVGVCLCGHICMLCVADLTVSYWLTLFLELSVP